MMFKKDDNKEFDDILKKKIGSSFIKDKVLLEDDDVYVCLFLNKNKNAFPNGHIIGINKKNKKVRIGYKSIDEILKYIK